MHKVLNQIDRKKSWPNAMDLASAIESEVLQNPKRTEVQYIINELISIFTDSALQDFTFVAKKIQQKQQELFTDVIKGYRDFCFLLRQWESLVSITEKKPFLK